LFQTAIPLYLPKVLSGNSLMIDLACKTVKKKVQESQCIAIGGVSRSGKTFLSEILSRYLENSIVIHQDTYIPPEHEIPLINDHIDWERPEAIDWISFENAIIKAKQSYKYVIVEGLFAFWNEKIDHHYDKHIFILLSKPVFEQRKREDLRWGAEPDWYIEHIWQGHLRYGFKPRTLPNCMVINGELDFDINEIIRQLDLPM